MTEHPTRVALYGYFGMGNIGNEASCAAFLAELRRRCPSGVMVHAFVAGAAEMTALHGVPAKQLMTHRGHQGRADLPELLRKVLGRVADPLRTLWLLREVDVLVVPGTGVLETQLMARPWGLPYWLFLATAACRARGGRVALVSVGAEDAAHPVTRLLFRSTVHLASYVSVRDEASRDVVRSWGRSVPVVPDLAFALPLPDCPPVRPGHVAIGVMAYEGDPQDRGRGPHVVETYAERMAEAVGRLVKTGRSVVLVAGDVADVALAEDIWHRATSRCGTASELVRVSSATTLEELMVELAQAEVTVVSRYHNLIAALKVARPTVSLSYAGKNGRLLEQFGLGEYVQPIDSFDVEVLLEQIERCRTEGPSLVVTAKEVLRRYDDELESDLQCLAVQLVVGRQKGRGPRRRRRGGLRRARR